MHCRNCGNELGQKSNLCLSCGLPTFSGKYFCDNCGGETDPHAVVCVSCGSRLVAGAPVYPAMPGTPIVGQKKPGPSGMAIAAFVLSIAAVAGQCLTAIPGLILGVIELKKIKRGESSPGGRGFALAAVIIGAVFTAFGLALIIVYVAAILLAIGAETQV